MYIYKMVYAEREDFKEEVYNDLKKLNLIYETDYGTTEILADSIVNFFEEEKDDEVRERVLLGLRNSLGEEKTNALQRNEIDMVMVVY